MASSTFIRRVAVSVIAGMSAISLTISLAPASVAEPSTAEVTTQLDTLSRKNEQLTELYNKASDDVKAKQDQAQAAKIAAGKVRSDYETARTELRTTLTDQFKGTGLGRTTALLTSSSKQNYLDQLTALQLLSAHRTTVTSQLKTTKATAEAAQAKAFALLADASAKQKDLAGQRTELAAEQDKYTKLLDKLNAEQRARFFATTNPTATATATQAAVTNYTVKAPSAAAAIAVKFALDQVGKPYVFAASGPDAYDCSGLTMAAWAAAGVSISHFAESQYSYGTHVARDQLKPGDLVFFYSPIGHVALYIGNGLIVHAPTSGDVVKVVPLSTFDSDYVGATRL